MIYVCQVENIKWDNEVDGELVEPPSDHWIVKVETETEADVEEAVSDKLSDDHGFCHKGFDMVIIDRLVRQTVVLELTLSLTNDKQADPLEWDWQSLLDLGPDEDAEVFSVGDFTEMEWSK